jgi:hypothetical protein
MSKNSSFLRLNYGDGTDTNTLNDTLNEIQRNYLIMSEEDQRKSSLNYFELLRLGNFLNNRNSNTSLIEINNKDNNIDNDNDKCKDREIDYINININNNNKNLSLNYTYDTCDIISVYFHMNYLKKFEFPEEFCEKKGNYFNGIIRKDVKNCLEKFKEKDVLLRSRAKSQILKITNELVKRCKNYLPIYFYFYFILFYLFIFILFYLFYFIYYRQFIF